MSTEEAYKAMARIRSIKPEFWTSEQVAECSRDARLLFIGMWNFCDDAGRHPASSRRLKMEVFPGDELSDALVTRWVLELVRGGLIDEYAVDGVPYWQVTGWKHQRIDQPNVRHPGRDGTTSLSQVRRLGGKQRSLTLRKLIDRDGEKCCNCGSEHNLTIDHIVAVSRGGSNELTNLQVLCKPCNNEKHAKVVKGDALVTRHVRDGDAPPEGSGVEWSGEKTDLEDQSSQSCTELEQPRLNGRAARSENQESVFDSLKLEDLSNTARLAEWLREQANGKSPIIKTPTLENLIDIVAAAEDALKRGYEPLKLFKSTVGKKNFDSLPKRARQRAESRVKKYQRELNGKSAH